MYRLLQPLPQFIAPLPQPLFAVKSVIFVIHMVFPQRANDLPAFAKPACKKVIAILE
jgi:hypothetical protein